MNETWLIEGRRVVLDDGKLGRLSNPRGCYCGKNGEACWDICLDEGGGVQAHGGTFRPEEPGPREWSPRKRTDPKQARPE